MVLEGKELTSEEQLRVDGLISGYHWGHEILLNLHQKGLVDAKLWNNCLANNFSLLTNPYFLAKQRERPGELSKEFMMLVESKIEDS